MSQAVAILWAQWRTLRNYLPHAGLSGTAFTALLGLLWYGLFTFLSFSVAVLISHLADPGASRLLPNVLLTVLIYWQLMPVLMASMGASLDFKKLLAYPIPHSQLFAIEVLLRLTTTFEILIILIGITAGLFRNPHVPLWAPLFILPFILFNLFLSTGVREILSRLMARRGLRELSILLFVLIAASPQYLVRHHVFRNLGLSSEPFWFMPYTATARLVAGAWSFTHLAVLLAFLAAAGLLAWDQFERGLRFDAAEASASLRPSGASRFEGIFGLPSRLFPDPTGALIEKELRSLVRTPRFRLVFLMGFTFGMLIWAPLAIEEDRGAFITTNYLMLVCVYSLLLLSDTLFWNVFGFDRAAAQVYFVAPVPLSAVLRAKNIAALSFVFLEVTLISLVCLLFRLPFTPVRFAEALATTLTVAIFLFCAGNLSSVHNPRPINPANAFRTTASSKAQAVIVLVFPMALAPVALAFAARYAFNTEIAFFVVMLLALGLGVLIYRISMDSALRRSVQDRDNIVAKLSRGEGPLEA